MIYTCVYMHLHYKSWSRLSNVGYMVKDLASIHECEGFIFFTYDIFIIVTYMIKVNNANMAQN